MTKIVTISMSEDKHKELKKMAIDRGETLSKMLVNAGTAVGVTVPNTTISNSGGVPPAK